jgi:hypothetical protein
LAKGTIERIGGEAIIRLQVEGHEPATVNCLASGHQCRS